MSQSFSSLRATSVCTSNNLSTCVVVELAATLCQLEVPLYIQIFCSHLRTERPKSLPSVTFYGLKIYLNALAAGSGELTGLPIPLAGFKGPLHGGEEMAR